MVLKRTETILICIVIVYSVKILESTIKTLSKIHYKSPKKEVCINTAGNHVTTKDALHSKI